MPFIVPTAADSDSSEMEKEIKKIKFFWLHPDRLLANISKSHYLPPSQKLATMAVLAYLGVERGDNFMTAINPGLLSCTPYHVFPTAS
jgi:hypothetical protein